MSTDQDDWDEQRAYFHQQVGDLQARVDRMTRAFTDEGLNSIALDVALAVEDLFAQHHDGGRTQRLAKMQVIVREAMRANLSGRTDWRASPDIQWFREK